MPCTLAMRREDCAESQPAPEEDGAAAKVAARLALKHCLVRCLRRHRWHEMQLVWTQHMRSTGAAIDEGKDGRPCGRWDAAGGGAGPAEEVSGPPDAESYSSVHRDLLGRGVVQ